MDGTGDEGAIRGSSSTAATRCRGSAPSARLVGPPEDDDETSASSPAGAPRRSSHEPIDSGPSARHRRAPRHGLTPDSAGRAPGVKAAASSAAASCHGCRLGTGRADFSLQRLDPLGSRSTARYRVLRRLRGSCRRAARRSRKIREIGQFHPVHSVSVGSFQYALRHLIFRNVPSQGRSTCPDFRGSILRSRHPLTTLFGISHPYMGADGCRRPARA